ncbi:MAG: hypothetical protein NTW20_07695 [Rhodobacterales bacterium]|nr:hypothetical protein [Rhodobacterales bacterium]
MSLLADLANWSLFAFAALMFLIQVAARELGGFFGSRSARTDTGNEGVGVIVSSILGLLAFVLALTLSTATSRVADRRSGGLEEANAIGTAWLQAKALDDPRAEKIAALLEDYILSRMAYVDADRGSETIKQATETTSALQTEIWGQISALVRDRPDPAITSLMNAVNHTFDMTTTQRFAVALSLPERMIWLLLSFTVVGMFALGYQLGLIKKPNRGMAMVLSVLWTAVLVQILDMGAARLGSYRTDLQPYQWTVESFSAIPVPSASP